MVSASLRQPYTPIAHLGIGNGRVRIFLLLVVDLVVMGKSKYPTVVEFTVPTVAGFAGLRGSKELQWKSENLEEC